MSEKIYGIDMGTNSIKIYQKAAGVILHQKNMIAMVKKKEPLALGDEAYSMYEKAPKNIEVKQPIVDKIAEEIKDAQSVVLVDYRGLTVAQDTELRKQLREAGVIYKVYKNTMMKRAFEGTEFAALDDCLEGPSAIAISKDDATAPARILYKFAQDAPALELKGGVVEGTAYDVAGISELAKIPSRDELISKLLGSLQSPITNLARVLNQIAEKGGADACEAAPAAEEAAEAPAAE